MPDPITQITPQLNGTNIGIGLLLAISIVKYITPYITDKKKNGNGNGNGIKKIVTEDVCLLRSELVKQEVGHIRNDFNRLESKVDAGFTSVEKLIRNGSSEKN